MLKRQAVESIEAQKHAMVAAMYANGNMDGDDISKAVESVEEHFQKTVKAIYGPPVQQQIRDKREPDWDNPFWAAAKRSYEKQHESMHRLRGGADESMSVEDVVALEERRAMKLREVDQGSNNDRSH
jgi:hypothetical protein